MTEIYRKDLKLFNIEILNDVDIGENLIVNGSNILNILDGIDDKIDNLDDINEDFGDLSGEYYNRQDGSGNNVHYGAESGYDNSCLGPNNTFIGKRAGFDSCGENNTALGFQSGYNADGSNNVFIGVNSGKRSLGDDNIQIGYQEIIPDISNSDLGNENIFIGVNSGLYNINGMQNVLLGKNAGKYMEHSSNNILLGYRSGQNVKGNNNIIIGNNLLANNEGKGISGENNIILGNYSGISGENREEYNNILSVQNKNDNYLLIGDFEKGNIGIGLNRLPNENYGLEVNGDISADNINLGRNVYATNLYINENASISGNVTANDFLAESDRTLKKDISTINDGLDVLNKLNPVYYKWKDPRKGKQLEIGFIAQEVEVVLPSLVKPVKNIKHVAYQKMTAILTSAIKQQQKTILLQNHMIQKQGHTINNLNKRLQHIENILSTTNIMNKTNILSPKCNASHAP